MSSVRAEVMTVSSMRAVAMRVVAVVSRSHMMRCCFPLRMARNPRLTPTHTAPATGATGITKLSMPAPRAPMLTRVGSNRSLVFFSTL